MPSKPKNVDPLKREWIRGQSCIIGSGCVGVTQCCHLRHGVHKDDREMFPGCAQHHTEHHSLGTVNFNIKYGIDLADECAKYHKQYLDYTLWRAG